MVKTCRTEIMLTILFVEAMADNVSPSLTVCILFADEEPPPVAGPEPDRIQEQMPCPFFLCKSLCSEFRLAQIGHKINNMQTH